jgi:transcriptional regulator with XRE-family HTH domain
VRAQRSFSEELPALLAERGLSQRKLAQLIDLNPSHLSRVLRGADRTRPSIDLIQRVADALGVPRAYFAEVREAAVIEKLRSDPELRDRLYDRLKNERALKSRRREEEV